MSKQFRNDEFGRSAERADRVARTYNLLAPEYDGHFETEIALAENSCVFQDLEARIGAYESVLDVACGTGLFLEYMMQSPQYYRGIDISSGMLAIATEKFKMHSFEQMDMANMSKIGDRRFDHVICLNNAINYTDYPASALSEMYRVLKDAGRIYLMAGSTKYPHRPSYICNLKNLYSDLIPMDAWELKTLAIGAGFRKVTVRGFHAYAEKWLNGYRREWIARYLRLEQATIGRFKPDSCYFLILQAEK
jgi:ubiquinone/menaquinone biosynthesis C-methylase UbiE